METTLRRLCEVHDLNTISVMYQVKWKHISVYPHFELDGEDTCASGTGETFGEAFEAAMREVRERREAEAEAAWDRQQSDLMESGGPDNTAYRRDMVAAGRGHLLTEA